MNNLTPDRLSAAADLVVRECRASVSLLQRHFRLGYADALFLMVQLASAGVVEEPNPAGRYHVALRRLLMRVENQPASVVHVRILRDLALYLLEHHGAESTQCVSMLAAPYIYGPDELREIVRGVLALKPQNSLFAVASALASLPQMVKRFPVSGIWHALQAECTRVTPQLERLEDETAARHAELVHAMRYLERSIMDDVDPPSRALDAFIHDDFLPQGRALHVHDAHGEHVVPSAFVQTKAMELLRYGIPADEIAEWIEPYMRVVWINKADANQLDGPERLKETMPDGWKFGRDCTYARLHHTHIRFTPPAEGPGCACGNADVIPVGRANGPAC